MISNVSVESIMAQKIEKEEALKESQKKKQFNKVEFNTDHYLNTRLGDGQQEKEIVIRLLPFSPEGGSPFEKVYVHSVKMKNEKGQKVWKKFMCPIGMKKSDRCPFCEASNLARQEQYATTDPIKKKELSSIEFMNRKKAYWLVRCIDRDHEDHGVKFWRFPDAKDGKGIWDSMISLMESRAKRGTNIFDLYQGKDLIIKVSKQTDAAGKEKTLYYIQDDDRITPLKSLPNSNEPDEATMEKWVLDPMTWEDVYTVKDFDYMNIVVQGEYPVWSKSLNRWIPKVDADKIVQEAKMQEIQDNLMPQTTDFSSFTIDTGTTKTEQAILASHPIVNDDADDDGLPF